VYKLQNRGETFQMNAPFYVEELHKAHLPVLCQEDLRGELRRYPLQPLFNIQHPSRTQPLSRTFNQGNTVRFVEPTTTLRNTIPSCRNIPLFQTRSTTSSGDLINTVQTNAEHWMLWLRGWTKLLSEMWRLPNLKVAEKGVKEGVTEEVTKGEGL